MSDQTTPQADEAKAPTPEETYGQIRLQILATALATVLFAVALVAAQGYAEVARWFPTAITTAGLVVCGGKLLLDIRRFRKVQAWLKDPAQDASLPQVRREVSEEVEPLTAGGRRELAIWVAHIVALLVAIRWIGIIPAAALWLPITLWLRGKRSWVLASCAAVGVVIVLLLLETQLSIQWPAAYFDIVDLLR